MSSDRDPSPDVLIRIRGLHKRFGGKIVLRGVDMDVRIGETKVIIGRSGVGKSVLLKCLMRLEDYQAGSIRLRGQELSVLSEDEMNRIRRSMGMVFQGGALFDSLTIFENVGFGLLEFDAAPYEEVRARVAEALSLTGLSGVEDLLPASLSGGMRKRASIARALCLRPEILLYDEPTTGVDPVTADVLNSLIMRLRDELGVTSLVVTHDMNSAFRIADSIAMLYHGQIIADGSVEEIRRSTHPIVRQFIEGKAQGPILEEETLLLPRAAGS